MTTLTYRIICGPAASAWKRFASRAFETAPLPPPRYPLIAKASIISRLTMASRLA